MNRARHKHLRSASISLVTAVLLALTVAACGSSTSGATTAKALLEQTVHSSIHSGVLDLTVTAVPKGSSVLTEPLVLSIDGPINDVGSKQPPQLDLTLNVSWMGLKESAGLILTSSHAYAMLSGKTYALPSSALKSLQSDFSNAKSGSKASGADSADVKAVDSLNWLTNPTIAGHQQLDGVATTHVRSTVGVAQLLDDLERSGATKSGSLSASERQKVTKALGTPTLDIWTGTNDKIVRKLALALRVPVTGTARTELSGLTAVSISLTAGLSDVNQPQTITTPTSVLPYKDLKTALSTLEQSLLKALSSGLLSGVDGKTAGLKL